MSEEYEVELKEKNELEDCPEGSRIILVFKNEEEYHGVFRGFDGDDTIKLCSETEKPAMIGLPLDMLKCWCLKL